MLQLIRGKVGSWFIKILFVVLILSFAVFGIGDLFQTGGVRATVATVGSERITANRLATAFQRELGRLQQIFGPNLDLELALSLGVLDQAMDGLVTESLFSQAAGTLGVQAPDAVIAEAIQQDPLFQDGTGRFNRNQFSRFLLATGQDEPTYLTTRRQDVAREQLVAAIGSGVRVPTTLAAALHRYRNETRDLTAILIGASAIGDVPAPTEEQIGAYYREQEQSFMAPELRVLRVVTLTPANIAEGIDIPENEIREQYDSRLDQYETPEQRAFEQIVVAEESIAARIAAATSGGTALSDAIVTVDGVEGSVIELDLGPRADFLPALAEAGFALPPGGISAPVQSPFGWHILQVTEITGGGISPYESVRDELEQELKLERALDKLFELANELDDLLASDTDLNSAANRLGLPVTVTPPVSRSGTLRDGSPLEGLPDLPQILATGFSIFDGATSTLEDSSEGGHFVVRAEQVFEPALRALDEVRETVIAGWTERETNAAIGSLATRTAERLDGGGSVSTIAAEIGGIIFEQTDLRRDGSNRGTLPEEIVTSIFEAAIGDIAVSPSEAGYVVARLDEVSPAPSSDDSMRQDIAAGQTQAITGDLLVGFAQSLRGQYDVDIDRDSMMRLFQQPQQHQHQPM